MELEQRYRTVIEEIERLNQRRQTVSTNYLTVNTAIIAVVAFLGANNTFTGNLQVFALLIIFLVGLLVSELWRRLVNQHTALLNWWYSALRDIEREFDEPARIYTREYAELYENGAAKHPPSLARYERALTYVFSAIYLLFALATLGRYLASLAP